METKVSKRELRPVMRARRAVCDPALGIRLAGHLLNAGAFRPDAIVAGFWPLPGEIDIRPVLLTLAGRGQIVGLPVTPDLGQGLSFRRWHPRGAMHAGRFGTLEPVGEPITPTIMLVPLLAFDRCGGRLGYGGGYYDRSLAVSRDGTIAIGCGFAVQKVDKVPTEPHDRAMDAVATEMGVIVMEKPLGRN